MRFHRYNAFLSTQLSFQDIQNILGRKSYQQLINHFKDRSDEMIRPAVFDAELEINKDAYDMAMKSFVVCKHHDSYDVIVYTCDGRQPYRKGNYFIREGRGYLAYTGLINHDDYSLESMEILQDVLANESSNV